ncbi:hypothetical protein ANN_23412 [Periplaneta americana]|uniref:Uncharacterized protein n=1 Tax=Periplaneta americana TaxID=6978 RepID=A0ABQ8SM93_PERAM|nr:hypothetical protein ANN_23412 [Periplaneta americana]
MTAKRIICPIFFDTTVNTDIYLIFLDELRDTVLNKMTQDSNILEVFRKKRGEYFFAMEFWLFDEETSGDIILGLGVRDLSREQKIMSLFVVKPPSARFSDINTTV